MKIELKVTIDQVVDLDLPCKNLMKRELKVRYLFAKALATTPRNLMTRELKADGPTMRVPKVLGVRIS